MSNPCRKQGPVLKSFGAFLCGPKPAQRMLPSITQHLWWDQYHQGSKGSSCWGQGGGGLQMLTALLSLLQATSAPSLQPGSAALRAFFSQLHQNLLSDIAPRNSESCSPADCRLPFQAGGGTQEGGSKRRQALSVSGR